jgi:hypothetical protein
MVGTITAQVSGGRRIRLGLIFLLVNVLVSAIVGVVLFLAAWTITSEAIWYTTIAASAIVGALLAALGRFPFLAWPRQLPQRWIVRSRPTRTTLRFASAWGLAFTTPIRSGSLLVLPMLVIAYGDPIFAAGAFGLMGFVRASPTAFAARQPLDDRLAGFSAWHRPLVGALDALLIAAVAGVSLKALMT